MILEVRDIHTYYGQSHILQGVSLEVDRGEMVTLLGRNGAGKTTTLKSIFGLVPTRLGGIFFLGERIDGFLPYAIARKKISYVPEERRIIPGLTVFENLKLAMLKNKIKSRPREEEVLKNVKKIFPRLEERWQQLGTSLSGGEQQMLAIARALVSEPALMLVDEPTEGLAPILVERIKEVLQRIQKEGVTILLVEQHIEMALKISQRAYVIDEGMIKYKGTSEEIRENKEVQKQYLAV
ncbi:MAG TPA: ABC transporter ATP-binding protein [Thermodesulfobacteriota bacterium]|nr:ABC transporter ATP-binding protein [Thermodesulfobacteriota bacterium]